jgi:hypothetical protein
MTALHYVPALFRWFGLQFSNRSRPFESKGYDSSMRGASLFAATIIATLYIIENKWFICN